METLLHTVGTCSDTHTHFDLIDLIALILSGSISLITIRLYCKTAILVAKDYILNIFKSKND